MNAASRALACLIILFGLTPRLTLAADPQWIDLGQIRPTQTHYGKAEVDRIVASYPNGLRPGESLQEKLKQYYEKNILRAVRGPDGLYYLTDGHHRTMALARTYAIYGEKYGLQGGPQLRVRVIDDYSKDSSVEGWKRFAQRMFKDSYCYLAPESMAKTGTKDPVKLFREHLPKRFEDLLDYPARSAIGTALYSFKKAAEKQNPPVPAIDPDQMIEYLEFRIAERLAQKGVEIPAGREFTLEIQHKITDAIFEDREMIEFLRKAYRRDRDEGVERANQDAVNRAISWAIVIHARRKTARTQSMEQTPATAIEPANAAAPAP